MGSLKFVDNVERSVDYPAGQLFAKYEKFHTKFGQVVPEKLNASMVFVCEQSMVQQFQRKPHLAEVSTGAGSGTCC